MVTWRPRTVVSAAASALLLGPVAVPPAGADSNPSEVPNPFQELSAREHTWVEMEHRDEGHRSDFYNDQANLLATSAQMRQQKNADAPRKWLPAAVSPGDAQLQNPLELSARRRCFPVEDCPHA